MAGDIAGGGDDAGNRSPPVANLDSQIDGAPFSPAFSFPSQPPDVANWFSSYRYESPEASELSGRLGSHLVGEEEEEEEEQSGDYGDSQAISQEIPALAADRNRKQSTLSNKHNINDDDDLNRDQDREDNIKLWPTRLPAEAEPRDPKLDLKAPGCGGAITELAKLDSDGAAEDGFISTRRTKGQMTNLGRSKVDDPASLSITREMIYENATKETDKLRKEFGRASVPAKASSVTESRGALADRTNTMRSVSSATEEASQAVVDLESTGKWRCPRRNKPLGGPLKQLRLERWVRRVLPEAKEGEAFL